MENIPNWCECELTIKGKKEELQKFKEYAFTREKYKKEDEEEFRDCVLDTEKFIPYPEEFKERDRLARRYDELKQRKRTKEEEAELLLLSLEVDGIWLTDGFNSGGYEWCCRNWGTKWGICHPNLNDITKNPKMSERELFYYFDTAWSPPIPVIVKMSEMFPDLKFNLKYYEGGEGYCGSMDLKKGIVLKDKYKNNYKGGRGG